MGLACVLLLASPAAFADSAAPEPAAPEPAAQDLAAAVTGSAWHLEGGLHTGTPAALGTGLSGGVGLAWLRAGTWGWGARVSYSQATEYTENWAVTHHELQPRVLGIVQTAIGRGWLGLRAGVGLTVLCEARARAQAARLGAGADTLDTSAWAALPAGEMEGFVALRVLGPIGVTVGAGPSLHVFQGAAVAGWLAHVSAVWWP